MAHRRSSSVEPEMALQLDHGKTGIGRLASLVLAVDAGSRQRLCLVLDRQDAEADGEAVLQRQRLQAMSALATDIIIMRRLAPDDAAERDIAVETCLARALRLRRDGEADGRRYLECARNGEALIAGAGGVERGDRALGELVRDMGVIARLDQHDMRRHVWLQPPRRSIGRCPTTARP